MASAPWKISRYQDGAFGPADVMVVEELPLTLYANGEEVVTLLTLGDNLLELALGFLRSEGFFSEREEVLGWEEEPGIVRVRLARDPGLIRKLMEKRTVTTGCGKGTTFYSALDALRLRPVESPLKLSSEAILARMNDLQQRSDLYRSTGGTHNATLADEDRTLLFRTDIGRHNAVDMISGRALLDGIDCTHAALLTTGRVSSEILLKVAKMRIGILISRSAPTALALRLAEEVGVTVVGYVRGGRFNVYTHPRRVEGAEHSGGCDE
ncbi:MAG: formate dehydrogenase accessory sulfurtransferase FdhD [Deltaproteobacteria bacterium]|nr:formate dehydrogenase accessory sulfurtransferase FdhD [Deltaproteobacteria bacterium]